MRLANAFRMEAMWSPPDLNVRSVAAGVEVAKLVLQLHHDDRPTLRSGERPKARQEGLPPAHDEGHVGCVIAAQAADQGFACKQSVLVVAEWCLVCRAVAPPPARATCMLDTRTITA
jgi:hypothetical protein